MGTFTSVSTVSYRYYDKRNRSVAEQNIQSMQRALGMGVSESSALRAMDKRMVISMALNLHQEMPDHG